MLDIHFRQQMGEYTYVNVTIISVEALILFRSILSDTDVDSVYTVSVSLFMTTYIIYVTPRFRI